MIDKLFTIECPTLIDNGGPKLKRRFLEFFGASIRNANTRAAYLKACAAFFAFIDECEVESIHDIVPLHVARWLEALQADGRSVATQQQFMAAVRMLLDFLVSGGHLASNPALSVRAPRQSVTKGKTATLTADECGALLRSISTDDLVGLRDRALIGVMVFTFARVSAACGLTAADAFKQKKRLWLRLHEKGGKVHDMPCHHTLEEYLAEYIDAAGLSDAKPTTPLFQSFKRRGKGDVGARELSGRQLMRQEAWQMVQRRAEAAGLDTHICNHTFRVVGITTYLSGGGTYNNAMKMAGHSSADSTQLYDRRDIEATPDEVEKISIG